MPRTSWGTKQQQKAIGARLRTIREERGVSQRRLSVPGISPAYISRIEAGDRMPSLNVLRILAERLEVSTEYLETGVERTPLPEEELEQMHALAETAKVALVDGIRQAADVFGYDLVPRG